MKCKFKCKHFLKIIKVLDYLAKLAMFIIVCILCSLSSKDPFKSHVIGNMTDYFNIYPNITTEIQSICACNNVIYENPCSKENILEGCLNLSSNINNFNPFLKRNYHLVHFVMI